MRLITLAIHTYDRALAIRKLLESEGIEATLQNINLEMPEVASGVRVRIKESDLPLALRIVENPEMFAGHSTSGDSSIGHNMILMPIDFTAHSLNAVNVALKLAADRKKSIVFIHSYMDPRLSGSVSLSDKLTFDLVDTDDSLSFASNAYSRMKTFSDSLREKMKSGDVPMTRFSTNVVEGVAEDVINDYVKQNKPYLVVMGTRTARQKSKEMIGSVTAQVLDESLCPVLSIPSSIDPDKFTSPKNILFFSNLDQEDIIAIDALYRFFPAANPNVSIVHIPHRSRFSDRDASRSAMALSDYCSKNFSHFNFKTIPLNRKTAAEELKKQQIVKKYDLIVVPNRKKNAFSRLFNPGLTYKLLFQTDIPMLVIPV